MDGGGADYVVDADATPQDVLQAIEKARLITPFVLRFFEHLPKTSFDMLQNEAWFSLSEQRRFMDIFGVEGMVQGYFVQVEWDIRKDEACHDEFGKPKAASAFPYESKSICLSVPLLSKAAKKVNLIQRIIGIIVHELAHKHGIVEEKFAKEIETSIVYYLPADPIAAVSARFEFAHRLFFEGEGAEIYEISAASLLRDTSSAAADNARVCAAVQRLDQTLFAIQNVYNISQNLPLEVLTSRDFTEIKSLEGMTEDLRASCLKHTAPPVSLLENIRGASGRIVKSLESIDRSLWSEMAWFRRRAADWFGPAQ